MVKSNHQSKFAPMTRGARLACSVAFALSAGSSFAQTGSTADADARILRDLSGDYGFTTLQSCVRTPFQTPPAAGFDPETRQLLVDGEAAQAIGSGVMHFGENGKVSASVLGTELSVDQTAAGQTPAAAGIEYNCSGSYMLQSGNRVSVIFPSCTVNTGNPKVKVTVGPLQIQGYVGIGQRSINLSLVNGSLQTVSVADTSGNLLQQRQRICIQSFALDKVANDR